MTALPLFGERSENNAPTTVGASSSGPRGIEVLGQFVSEFDDVPLGAAMVEGPDAEILHANPSLVELLGSRHLDADLVGASLFDLFDLDDGTAAMNAFRQTAAGLRCSAGFKVHLRLGTGPSLPMLIVLTNRPVAFGEVPHGLCLFIDRTGEEVATLENVDLEQRVTDRTAELEAFTYSVSHDLHAPLRAIMGFSELLLSEAPAGLPENHRHYLERISNGARRMGVLIDDLLTFSRLGRQALRKMMVEPRPLVDRILDDLSGGLSGRQVEITVGTLPAFRGDPELVGLVFQNLLGNAVKFSSRQPCAHITVSGSEGPDGVTYEVTDDGVGFDEEYSDKLFEVFQRLHSAEEFEGTGVGLANVARIVHRHGGVVSGASPPEGGATFRFTLPGGRDE
jgi:signal transduction histidine kinase